MGYHGESGTLDPPGAPSRRRLGVFVALLALILSSIPATPAQAAISPSEFEECLLDLINDDRGAEGASPLIMASSMTGDVRDWSSWMSDHTFRHMYQEERNPILPAGISGWGENIAQHSYPGFNDCSTIHSMFMNSSGHRDNIMNPGFTHAALGAHVDSSGWWVTELFVRCDGRFCDDETSVFQGAIEKIADEGITQGCGTDRYCPDDYVTRGQMAAFLVRSLSLGQGDSVDFVDDDDSIFEDAIERLAAAGITKGCNPPANDRFCPDEYVSRGEMAAFLARALPLPPPGGTDFVDDDDSVFESAIERIAAAGITLGCNPPTNDEYCPREPVTRGAMAAFLARALDL